MKSKQYKRVLLKLGGESFASTSGCGIDYKALNDLADELKEVKKCKVEIGIVIGGGNIVRGIALSEKGMGRVTADYMGMLGTVINGLALQHALESKGVHTRVQTAIGIEKVAEPYIRRRAIRHLEKGRIVIFAAGTGNPYFTTDTAAALRAIEIGADVILKATKVDGIYDKDPLKYSDVKKYHELDYLEVLKNRLKIMDSTSISLCMDNVLPIIVFSIKTPGNIKRVIQGEKIGTMVHSMAKK